MNVHVRTCPFSDRKVDVKERYLSSSKIKCLGPLKGKEKCTYSLCAGRVKTMSP